jgi:hypothetical protein
MEKERRRVFISWYEAFKEVAKQDNNTGMKEKIIKGYPYISDTYKYTGESEKMIKESEGSGFAFPTLLKFFKKVFDALVYFHLYSKALDYKLALIDKLWELEDKSDFVAKVFIRRWVEVIDKSHPVDVEREFEENKHQDMLFIVYKLRKCKRYIG